MRRRGLPRSARRSRGAEDGAPSSSTQELHLQEQAKIAARREGLQEGAAQKARLTLTKLLQLKFGQRPPQVLERVETASEPELDGWLEQTMTADTPESVPLDAGPQRNVERLHF